MTIIESMPRFLVEKAQFLPKLLVWGCILDNFACFLPRLLDIIYIFALTRHKTEVDYLRVRGGKVFPVEVKANTQGSMQSLWIFMRKRQLHEAIRTSLENFGQFDHYDPKDNFEQRHVDIVPLYALSNLEL